MPLLLLLRLVIAVVLHWEHKKWPLDLTRSSSNFRKKPLGGMVMTEVHLYKRTDGGRFKNSMGGSEESGYGNLVKKCQTLITSPHSKSFLAGLLGSDFSPLLPANHLQSTCIYSKRNASNVFMSLCPKTLNGSPSHIILNLNASFQLL